MKKRPVAFADLHTHSTASDGTLSPGELVEKAESIGLSVLALTDHDTISGLKEAKEAAKDKKIKIVSGTELSCGWPEEERSVHVLGLFISYEKSKLSDILDKQRELRYRRAIRILGLLRKEGLDMDELEDWFKSEPNRVLGRPHIARHLVNKGYIKDFNAAFKKYLNPGCPAYIKKDYTDFNLAIEAIHDAGGIAVLAHPGLIPTWKDTWEKIKDLPWDGIESFYVEHDNKSVKKFFELAQHRNIASTGGSDYHGDSGNHPDRLGQGGLSEEQFQELMKFIEARGISFK